MSPLTKLLVLTNDEKIESINIQYIFYQEREAIVLINARAGSRVNAGDRRQRFFCQWGHLSEVLRHMDFNKAMIIRPLIHVTVFVYIQPTDAASNVAVSDKNWSCWWLDMMALFVDVKMAW